MARTENLTVEGMNLFNIHGEMNFWLSNEIKTKI